MKKQCTEINVPTGVDGMGGLLQTDRQGPLHQLAMQMAFEAENRSSAKVCEPTDQ